MTLFLQQPIAASLIMCVLLVGCRNVQEPEPKATDGTSDERRSVAGSGRVAPSESKATDGTSDERRSAAGGGRAARPGSKATDGTSDEPATVFANIGRAIEDNDPEAFINSCGPLSDEVRQILQAQFNVLRASHLLRKEIRDRFGEDALAEFEKGIKDNPFFVLPDTMFAKLDWVQEIEVVDDRANVIVAAEDDVDPARRTAEGMLIRIDGQWRMNAEHLAEIAKLPERQREESMEGSERLVRIYTALREHAAEEGSSVAAVLEDVAPLLLGIDRRSMPKPPSLPDVPVRPLESLPEQVEVKPTDPELAFAGEPVALQLVHVFGGLGPISAVAVSSDGSRVVSASPATLALWDAASGELLAMPKNIAPRNNPREISSIGFSPDGSRLLINGGGFIEIWDPQTLQRLHVIEDSRIGRDAVFARDGSTVVASHHLALVCGLAHGGGYAVTQRGLKVQVVRTGNGERLTEVTQPGLKVQIVDPLVVALARLGGLKVQIVDPGNRERLTEIDLEPLLGDTDWVVIGRSKEGRDRRYGIKEDAADKTHYYISCLNVSSDGSHLVTVVGRTVTSKLKKEEDGDSSTESWEVRHEASRTATLWDVKTGKPIHSFEGRPGLDSKDTTPGTNAEPQIRQVAEGAAAIRSVRFTPTGEHLLIGAGVKASLWNVASAERIAGFEDALGAYPLMGFSEDGRYVLTGRQMMMQFGGMTLRETHTGRVIQTFDEPYDMPGDLGAVAFSPDGTYLAMGSTRALAFSPDGKRLVEAGNNWGDHRIVVWDRMQDKPLHHLSGGPPASPRIWNVETGAKLHTLDGHRGPVTSVAFSPCGRYVATGSLDSSVILWDVETGEKVRIFHEKRESRGLTLGDLAPDARENRVLAVAISPDRRRLVTGEGWQTLGGARGTVRMWDVDSGQRVEAFQVDEMENVGSVHFTPDGSRLLSQEGSRLRVRDARTGAVLRTFAGSFAGWDEGAGRPRSIALSPGGKYVLAIVEPHPPRGTADRERPVVLLDVDSGDLLRYIPRMGHRDTAAVGFSPCGKYVLTVDQFERMARLWKVE